MPALNFWSVHEEASTVCSIYLEAILVYKYLLTGCFLTSCDRFCDMLKCSSQHILLYFCICPVLFYFSSFSYCLLLRYRPRWVILCLFYIISGFQSLLCVWGKVLLRGIIWWNLTIESWSQFSTISCYFQNQSPIFDFCIKWIRIKKLTSKFH